jgi:hypothetical protein
MKYKRRFATLTTIANSSTFIIGGEESSKKRLNTIEKLFSNNNNLNNNNNNYNNNNNKNNNNNNNEWVEVDPLVETISRHCAVSVRDKEIFLIGGYIGTDQFSDQTMTFDTTSNKSKFLSSKLNKGRQLHSCAKMNSNNFVIVVGGRNLRGALKSVELLNLKSLRWTEPKDLQLPKEISYAEIVAHPSGD